jgi:hypothetical protein
MRSPKELGIWRGLHAACERRDGAFFLGQRVVRSVRRRVADPAEICGGV